MALRAPSTSRCDFCQVSFCGIVIPDRCHATSLQSQYLNGFSDLGDLIQAADIYDCFGGNTVEVEMFFDYLTEHRVPPKQIYQEVCFLSPIPRSIPSNHFPRLSIKFRTPLNNSHHCSTRISSPKFTALPEVSILIHLPLVRRSAGYVPPKFFCGVSAIGGSGRGGRVSSQLTSRTASGGSLAEIRRIQVRPSPSLGKT